jgi:hypothetical protein
VVAVQQVQVGLYRVFGAALVLEVLVALRLVLAWPVKVMLEHL